MFCDRQTLDLIQQKLKIHCPDEGGWTGVYEERPWPAFAPESCIFVNDFSQHLLQNSEFRKSPEWIALGYWFRKSNVEQIRLQTAGGPMRLGKGLAYHIAPANVDPIFLYSSLLSLLAGNANIIRVSSSASTALLEVVHYLKQFLTKSEHASVRNRLVVLQYEHDPMITRFFSSHCDLRVIWGGNNTIAEIREIPLASSAAELVFPDRFSLCVLNAESYINAPDKELISSNFYNDAFWFDQMACSSPKLVLWVGNSTDVNRSKEIFWNLLDQKLREKNYESAPSWTVNKITAQYAAALHSPHVRIINSISGLFHRVIYENLDEINRDLHCGAGLFFECRLNSLNPLASWLSPDDQTVTHYGLSEEEIQEFLSKCRPRGVTRFVPIGKALEFSRFWDGHDLVNEFSRIVEIN